MPIKKKVTVVKQVQLLTKQVEYLAVLTEKMVNNIMYYQQLLSDHKRLTEMASNAQHLADALMTQNQELRQKIKLSEISGSEEKKQGWWRKLTLMFLNANN